MTGYEGLGWETVRVIRLAEYSLTLGSIPSNVVRELIDIVCKNDRRNRAEVAELYQRINEMADRFRHEKHELERQIVAIDGPYDRRGLDREPRGLIVKEGIHEVVEDSR
jgi:hypothetical protein